jgi:outer membrane protein insertion porin family/translocation and assembly module TamA
VRDGRPLDEEKVTKAETDVKRALTDHAYAWAKVTSDSYVDLVSHHANVVLTVNTGPPAKFGRVTLVGIGSLPEAPLRRAIDIDEGAPYSTNAIDAATQALLDLEVMSSVEITPDLPDPPPPSRDVPLTVTVEPTKLRRVRAGGGLEFDQIKTDVHLLFGWEDHDFFGSLRDFTVDVKPGLVLYPTRINQIEAPERVLPEERLRMQLKQPGFLEARTNGFIRPELNTFPLLVKTNPSPSDPVVGYVEFRGTAGVDRTLWKLLGSLAYNAQVEYPFAYKGDLDPALRTLVISYPELITQLDLRDNHLRPHSGVFLGNDLQVAGGPFLGDAIDLRVQPEARTYLPLGRHITFATRASVGFLLPSSYGDVVKHLGDPSFQASHADQVRDLETMFFRGFFSGGSTSNRGFPIRGIAPHGVVPFLNPQTASQQAAQKCDPTQGTPDPVLCSTPVGGFTLWELSNEFRFDVSGPLSFSTFCDMSDVSATPGPAGLRFDHLHLSCGLGARYDTPVGPVRLDIGYRVQPLQVLGYPNESAANNADPREGQQPRIFGQPIAVAIGIGEAF